MIGNWLCSVNDFPISQMESNTHTQNNDRTMTCYNNSVSAELYQYELFTSLWQQHCRLTWSCSSLISIWFCPVVSQGPLGVGLHWFTPANGGLAEPVLALLPCDPAPLLL